jgi:hypothetical protein
LTRHVWLEVDTLQPPDAVATAAVAWLDEVYRETLAPLAESIGARWMLLQLNEPPPRSRLLRSEKDWTDALDMLLRPDARSLALSTQVREMRPAEGHDEMISVRADLRGYWRASWLRLVLVAGATISRRWPALQGRLLDHLAAAAETLDATTGFITSDNDTRDALTVYENEMRMMHGEGLVTSDRLLRGVFWCTLLSQRHLDALGGIGRVEHEAPAAQTRRLQSHSGRLLLLQTSDDLASFDPEELAPLREFLAPVLPPRRPLPEWPGPESPRSEPTVNIDPDIDADIVVRLSLQGELNQSNRETLEDLFDSWYLLAVHGVFGDPVHNMDAPAYEQNGETTEGTIEIDVGNAGTQALDPLIRLLLSAAGDLTVPLLQISIKPR